MIIGAVDIGTNSCRLLIAEVENGRLNILARGLESTSLGQGVHTEKILNETAIERTINGLASFKQILDQYQVNTYRIVATNAVREAENGKVFIQALADRLGLKGEVVSGSEEADLSYLGVKKGLPLSTPIAVIDLGGGSTEFIWEDENGRVNKYSLPLGAVRAYEADMSEKEIKSLLERLKPYEHELRRKNLVIVGGTATTLAAMHLKLEVYDPAVIHGYVLTIREVKSLLVLLMRLSAEERKALPGLRPERADIISNGLQIVSAIMENYAKESIIISESDILEGIIWRQALEKRAITSFE